MQFPTQLTIFTPMKLFAAITSVYLLMLTAVPCADAHLFEHGHDVQLEQKCPDSHTDGCTVFCTCSCCQTLTTPAAKTQLATPAEPVEIIDPVTVSPYSDYVYAHWRPPKG